MLRIRATASLKNGGVSPVSLFVSQSSATAVRANRFRLSRRTRLPSGSSMKRAVAKAGPSFSPSRRHQNTSANAPQVVRSGSPKAGPWGCDVGNQEMVRGVSPVSILVAVTPLPRAALSPTYETAWRHHAVRQPPAQRRRAQAVQHVAGPGHRHVARPGRVMYLVACC